MKETIQEYLARGGVIEKCRYYTYEEMAMIEVPSNKIPFNKIKAQPSSLPTSLVG